MRLPGVAALVVSLLPFVLRPGMAAADPLEVPSPADAASAPATRYGNLGESEALAELERRGIAFVRVPPGQAPGVRTPIRLAGRLHGVHVHSSLPVEERGVTPFEILDARLALALDDFARVLSTHDVVELVHYTMYRPTDEQHESPAGARTRHPAGLAIDLGALRKRGGNLLSIKVHWPPAIGARTCGKGAAPERTRRARELRSIVCEARDLRLFHVMLTPHHDPAHADHVHLEIEPDVRWFLVN